VPAYDSPAAPSVDDIGILAQLLPDRGKTKFLRGVAILFLAFGGLGSLSVLWDVFTELHARHSWPVADGFISSREIKSNKGRPGNTTRGTRYWMEYEVRFAVPAAQCLTGTISSDVLDPFPCWGTVRTGATGSWTTVSGWAPRHPLNSPAQILHDPQGPNVKIADESPWLVYPWNSIVVIFTWVACFSTMLNVIQRRLRFLETLAEDYTAAAPQSPKSARDDLIDLRLS
jgi:hypothetical protein